MLPVKKPNEETQEAHMSTDRLKPMSAPVTKTDRDDSAQLPDGPTTSSPPNPGAESLDLGQFETGTSTR